MHYGHFKIKYNLFSQPVLDCCKCFGFHMLERKKSSHGGYTSRMKIQHSHSLFICHLSSFIGGELQMAYGLEYESTLRWGNVRPKHSLATNNQALTLAWNIYVQHCNHEIMPYSNFSEIMRPDCSSTRIHPVCEEM